MKMKGNSRMNEHLIKPTRTFRGVRVLLTTFAILLGVAFPGSGANAQSSAGTLQGTISDPSGAVIPGAQVHVVNNATGVASDAKSNGVGLYTVPDLFSGEYTLTITAPNMKTDTKQVQILSARTAVFNFTLTPGAVTEKVEVKGDYVQLTTTDSGVISNTLDSARIDQLPENGRELNTLAGMITPGLDSNGQRANGLMAAALDYVADGVVMTNRQFGGEYEPRSTLPDPDSVQEVQIQTVTTGAQYEAPATAVITTKSGTNRLHGSVFETARNNSVLGNARPRALNYILPKLVRNEFGASAGGPLIIPKLYDGRNRTFWFFAYERFSLSQSTPQNVTVPMDAWRNGDFSGLVNSAGTLQTLYDSSTTANSATCAGSGGGPNVACRMAYNKNQIPMSSESPVAKVLFDITPRAATGANPLIASNLSVPNITYQVVPTYTFRLDQVFNEKNKAYLRFTQDTETLLSTESTTQPATIAADGLPANVVGLTSQPNTTIGSALGYTHIFSSTFFSETIAAMEWAHQVFGELGSGVNAPNYEAQLGLPNNFGEGGFPNISGGVTTYQTSQGSYALGSVVSSIDENLTKIRGRQQFLFGGRFRHERDFNYNHQSNDSLSWSNQSTALLDPTTVASKGFNPLPNTGNANADMFLGSASAYTVVLQAPNTHSHQNAVDAYFQDNFHVSDKLTLNLGLRWENHIAPWVKDGVLTTFDIAHDAPVLSAPVSDLIAKGYTTPQLVANYQALGVVYETPQQAGMPAGLLYNYPWEFAPRVGAAWQPFGTRVGTVLRGGYGRYLYPIPTRNSFYNNTTNNGPYRTSYVQNYTAASQSPDGNQNYLLRSPQAIVAGVNSSGVVNTSTTNALTPGQGFYAFDPHFKPATVDETNVTIEQKLPGNSALRVSWVWTHGSNLDMSYNINQHPTGYSYYVQTGLPTPTGTYASVATGPYDQKIWNAGLTYQEQAGWSNDNNLQVTYQRLFHSGVAYQISYVRSKAFRVGGNSTRDSIIDTAQSYVTAKPVVAQTLQTYGPIGAQAATPPARPAGIPSYADYHALDVYEEYKLDTAIPVNHVTFNGILDLPFGRGKRFFGNVNGFWNQLIGGYQIAGDGNVVSQNFAVTASHWGATNPITLYKHSKPVTDCRSGTCLKGYEWFNGYVAPTVAAGHNNGCTLAANNVSGLPSDWMPYQAPIDNDCTSKYYGSDEVQVQAATLNGGNPLDVAYSPGTYGINPYGKKIIAGPMNWTADISIFKVFPITKTMFLRVNADAFNVFNMQGWLNPDSTTGIESATSSYNTPRQIQLTARFTF